jgi:hypothetical protein
MQTLERPLDAYDLVSDPELRRAAPLPAAAVGILRRDERGTPKPRHQTPRSHRLPRMREEHHGIPCLGPVGRAGAPRQIPVHHHARGRARAFDFGSVRYEKPQT